MKKYETFEELYQALQDINGGVVDRLDRDLIITCISFFKKFQKRVRGRYSSVPGFMADNSRSGDGNRIYFGWPHLDPLYIQITRTEIHVRHRLDMRFEEQPEGMKRKPPFLHYKMNIDDTETLLKNLPGLVSQALSSKNEWKYQEKSKKPLRLTFEGAINKINYKLTSQTKEEVKKNAKRFLRSLQSMGKNMEYTYPSSVLNSISSFDGGERIGISWRKGIRGVMVKVGEKKMEMIHDLSYPINILPKKLITGQVDYMYVGDSEMICRNLLYILRYRERKNNKK